MNECIVKRVTFDLPDYVSSEEEEVTSDEEDESEFEQHRKKEQKIGKHSENEDDVTRNKKKGKPTSIERYIESKINNTGGIRDLLLFDKKIDDTNNNICNKKTYKPKPTILNPKSILKDKCRLDKELILDIINSVIYNSIDPTLINTKINASQEHFIYDEPAILNTNNDNNILSENYKNNLETNRSHTDTQFIKCDTVSEHKNTNNISDNINCDLGNNLVDKTIPITDTIISIKDTAIKQSSVDSDKESYFDKIIEIDETNIEEEITSIQTDLIPVQIETNNTVENISTTLIECKSDLINQSVINEPSSFEINNKFIDEDTNPIYNATILEKENDISANSLDIGNVNISSIDHTEFKNNSTENNIPNNTNDESQNLLKLISEEDIEVSNAEPSCLEESIPKHLKLSANAINVSRPRPNITPINVELEFYRSEDLPDTPVSEETHNLEKNNFHQFDSRIENKIEKPITKSELLNPTYDRKIEEVKDRPVITEVSVLEEKQTNIIEASNTGTTPKISIDFDESSKLKQNITRLRDSEVKENLDIEKHIKLPEPVKQSVTNESTEKSAEELKLERKRARKAAKELKRSLSNNSPNSYTPIKTNSSSQPEVIPSRRKFSRSEKMAGIPQIPTIEQTPPSPKKVHKFFSINEDNLNCAGEPETLNRNQRDFIREKDILIWIYNMIDEPARVDFEFFLKDGCILCKLMNKIKPDSIAESEITWEGARSKQRNLTLFINAAEKYGVPKAKLFFPEDLLHLRHIPRVTRCIYALAKIAQDDPELGSDCPRLGDEPSFLQEKPKKVFIPGHRDTKDVLAQLTSSKEQEKKEDKKAKHSLYQ